MTDKLDGIREALPAVRQYMYFNNGTYGPMTVACEKAMRDWHRDELEMGRIAPEGFKRAAAIKDEARATLARLINAKSENIALTRHTTEGMNIATFGYVWKPGDEIVATDVEHGGGLLPIRLAEKRFGIKVRLANVGLAGGDITAAIVEQITPRTRLAVLSHVSYSTGACFDAKAIIKACHDRGVPVAVDGAQTVGAIPIDVADLDVDFYAFSGQKWLLGPSGTGALYVRSDRIEEIDPPLIGTGAVSSHEDLDHYVLWSNAKKFEGASTVNLAAVKGLAASVSWLMDEVGTEWAFSRSRALTERALQGIRSLPGVEVITPDSHANLVCFRVAGVEAPEVVSRLAQEGAIIRSVSETASARFSVGFYNTESEIDRAIELVRKMAE